MKTPSFVGRLIQSGLGNPTAYPAEHVQPCLIPAFPISGTMIAPPPTEAVTRFLGRNASRRFADGAQ